MARNENNHHVLPLFCDDLIASTVDMTPACFGAYMRILCYAWTRGGVPNDDNACCRIAGGIELCDWSAIRLRLVLLDSGTPDERLSHARLELERQKVAELKAKKSKAGKKGNRKRWEKTGTNDASHSDRTAIANASQNDRKTIAPTPTPTPTPLDVIHTHTPTPVCEREPWLGKALDRWVPFREEWNQTDGAEPWHPLTPPSGSAWLECVSNSSWLEQYPIALSKLAGLRRFKHRVTLTQFLSDGWVGRIVAGDFDKEITTSRQTKQRPAASNF
jgi:uncharacterized protein YdaU (DUF1376 family)